MLPCISIYTRMMRMLLHFLSVLIGVLTIFVLIQADDQSGFISLDCGLPEHMSYSALNTGINYVSDAKFIDSGVSKKIRPPIIPQELTHLRSFPIGVRNCYKISVTSGTKYLIRASFYYGNYDDLNDPPQFDIHFGANVWDTVKLITNSSLATFREMIYTPSQDNIQPCLVNTGKGTPFISAIELRTLNDYDDRFSAVLSLFKRCDLGSITNREYRYKYDAYDRIWSPCELSSDWRRLSTSFNSDDLSHDLLGLPAVVMNTAVTPVNASSPLQFHWDADNTNDQFQVYLYFNEVEKLPGNETRALNITSKNKVNGFEIHIDPSTHPGNETKISTFMGSPLTGATSHQITLSKIENSTHPPILNAFEIYKAKVFSQSETDQDDVDTMTNIKDAYGVARNWQGDPCGPVNYMWEGLNCSIDDGNNIPRITSL